MSTCHCVSLLFGSCTKRSRVPIMLTFYTRYYAISIVLTLFLATERYRQTQWFHLCQQGGIKWLLEQLFPDCGIFCGVVHLSATRSTHPVIGTAILTGYYMGYTLIWVLSTSDTCHITNEWAQRTSEWCDMCHELIKSISKCNPCYNLFITYHIHGIVRMYQWVRNAILACLMITYDTVNGLFCAMHVRPRILFTLRLRCFLNILWWL